MCRRRAGEAPPPAGANRRHFLAASQHAAPGKQHSASGLQHDFVSQHPLPATQQSSPVEQHDFFADTFVATGRVVVPQHSRGGSQHTTPVKHLSHPSQQSVQQASPFGSSPQHGIGMRQHAEPPPVQQSLSAAGFAVA
jgi:hypothetical protein